MATIYPISSSSEASSPSYGSPRFRQSPTIPSPIMSPSDQIPTSEIPISTSRAASPFVLSTKGNPLIYFPWQLLFQIFPYLQRNDIAAFFSINRKLNYIFHNENTQKEIVELFWGKNSIWIPSGHDLLPTVRLPSEHYLKFCMANGEHGGEHARGIATRIQAINPSIPIGTPPEQVQTMLGRQIVFTQFVSDGSKFFVRRRDDTQCIYDMETPGSNELAAVAGPIDHICTSFDGNKVLFSLRDSNDLKLLDVKTGSILRQFAPSDRLASITHVEMSDDGAWALVQYNNATVRFWNLESSQFTELAVSPDCIARLLRKKPIALLAKQFSGEIQLYDLEKKEMRFFQDGTISLKLLAGLPIALIFTYLSTLLSTLLSNPHNRFYEFLLNFIVVFSILIAFLPSNYNRERTISNLQINSQGTKALSVSFDHVVKVWDLKKGECERTFVPGENIETFQITPNGKKALLLTRVDGSNRRTLSFWDLYMGKCLQILQRSLPHSALALPDHGMAAYALSMSMAFTWNLSLLPLHRVCLVAKALLQDQTDAWKLYNELLPDFVRVGEFVKARLDGADFESADRKYDMANILCDYIKKFFLSDIRDAFEKAEDVMDSERTDKFYRKHFKAALDRFHDLPPDIQYNDPFKEALELLEDLPDLIKFGYFANTIHRLETLPRELINHPDFQNALNHFKRLPIELQNRERFHVSALNYWKHLPVLISNEIFRAIYQSRASQNREIPSYCNESNFLNILSDHEISEAIESVRASSLPSHLQSH